MVVNRGRMLVAIGAFKLGKAVLLLALGLGVLRLGDPDVRDLLARLTAQLQIDPEGRHLGRMVQALVALDERQLRAVSAALCAYSVVFLTEGIGLLLRKRWAEYFTTIVTASLVPLEVYEFARHPSAIRMTVLLANIAIVWYLARGLPHRGSSPSRLRA